MTNRPGSCDRSVMMSSVMPSAKYSCSGSPLMLVNGSTAIEGLPAAARCAAPLPRWRLPAGSRRDRPGPAGDVLERLLAQSLEVATSSLPRTWSWTLAGDADAARLGQRLQPRGDVDAVAVDVVALDDDVAEIDADAEDDALGPPAAPALRRGHRLLDRDGALDGVDDAGELDQHAVAHQLDDAAAMLGTIGSSDCLAPRLQRRQRADSSRP